MRMRVAVHGGLGPHEQPISYVYELVAAHELPQVDLSKSLRSVFCGSSGSKPGGWRSSSSRHRERPTSCLRKLAGILAAGYMTGLILCILIPWLSRKYGRPIATLATALTVPSVLVSFRPMRYDIMLVLVKTYDFWYLESINTLSCILLALYFDDVRAIAMLVPWVGNLSSALVDANTRAIRHLLVASIVGAIVNCAMLVCVQLRLVDATKHFTIFKYGGRVLSVEDVVVNGLATHLLLLLRNVYRRTQFLAHRRLNNWSSSLVHCINHRCATKLQLVPRDALPLSRSLAGGSGHTKISASQPPLGVEVRLPRIQMMYVKADFTFNAKNTFVPTEINDTAWPVWKRVVLRCVALLGILLPITGALEMWTLSQRQWLFYVAFTCTQLFCSLTWAFSQRQLFWKIVFSFDYFFISFQLSSLHVCACDMVSWNASCLGIMSSCFWMHFVLTADALTPVVRRKIGFRTRFLVLPVVLFVYFQASIWFRLVVKGDNDLRDRELFEVLVGNHRIEFRVIPFFFSRLATTLVWSLRLIWRIFGTQGDETLLLRGIVAYEYASPSNAAAVFPEATTSEEPQTR